VALRGHRRLRGQDLRTASSAGRHITSAPVLLEQAASPAATAGGGGDISSLLSGLQDEVGPLLDLSQLDATPADPQSAAVPESPDSSAVSTAPALGAPAASTATSAAELTKPAATDSMSSSLPTRTQGRAGQGSLLGVGSKATAKQTQGTQQSDKQGDKQGDKQFPYSLYPDPMIGNGLPSVVSSPLSPVFAHACVSV
jgi:hypothetical protein